MTGSYDPVFVADDAGSCFDPSALSAATNKDAVDARHPEWVEHHLRWRWLLDSLEGGERYRQAIYGFDWRGMPVRNLIRHKREYPDAETRGAVGPYSSSPVGSDQAMPATDDDYELRRARTPVPTFVAETIDQYIGKIFAQKVKREIPETADFAGLRAWFADADGKGTDFDSWMADTVGRLLLNLGCLDVLLCHPTPPDGETITSRYDELRLNVFGCTARVILPNNLTYWRLDARGRYTLAVVQEWSAGGDADPRFQLGQVGPMTPFGGGQSIYRPQCRYRVWLPDRWALYDAGGAKIDEAEHPFGVVPIVRLFCRRKPRCENVGQSPVESIAERQREYYNRDSELILSDVLQAHPVIMAPEDCILPDRSVPLGPGYLLPKKKSSMGTTVSYEGWDVLEFPKGGADSIRSNKAEIRDDVDRDAGLVKPAGASGTGRSTVAQSGVSKQLDNETLHNRLSTVVRFLEEAENRLIELALIVLHDGDPPRPNADGSSPVEIQYPRQFHLNAADRLAAAAIDFQAVLAAAGDAPDAESKFLAEIFRKAIPGLDDRDYEAVDAEIARAVDDASKRRDESRESIAAVGPSLEGGGPPAPPQVLRDDPSDDDAEDDDESPDDAGDDL